MDGWTIPHDDSARRPRHPIEPYLLVTGNIYILWGGINNYYYSPDRAIGEGLQFPVERLLDIVVWVQTDGRVELLMHECLGHCLVDAKGQYTVCSPEEPLNNFFGVLKLTLGLFRAFNMQLFLATQTAAASATDHLSHFCYG